MTILVPGPIKGPLRMARRVPKVAVPRWRRTSKLFGHHGRQRLPNIFAPRLFFLAFSLWLLLLLMEFGMMFHALSNSFSPALAGFDQALYVAGSCLLTLGLSDVSAHGVAPQSAVRYGAAGVIRVLEPAL